MDQEVIGSNPIGCTNENNVLGLSLGVNLLTNKGHRVDFSVLPTGEHP